MKEHSIGMLIREKLPTYGLMVFLVTVHWCSGPMVRHFAHKEVVGLQWGGINDRCLQIRKQNVRGQGLWHMLSALPVIQKPRKRMYQGIKRESKIENLHWVFKWITPFWCNAVKLALNSNSIHIKHLHRNCQILKKTWDREREILSLLPGHGFRNKDYSNRRMMFMNFSKWNSLIISC